MHNSHRKDTVFPSFPVDLKHRYIAGIMSIIAIITFISSVVFQNIPPQIATPTNEICLINDVKETLPVFNAQIKPINAQV